MAYKNLLKILFVEDLPSDVDLAVRELQKEKLKFEHTTVCTRADLIKALNEFKPDLIISDYMMPAFNGLQALKEVKEFNPEIPFILCTGSINEETAVECIKAGADDYVIKEHMTRLPFAVKEALEQHMIRIEKRAAELLLKENEEKLQSIFSAAPVGIGLVVNRVFMEVNDTFCKITGYTRKELIGKNAEMIYATNEEYESVGIDKYRQFAEKGTGSVETRFKCKDGRILNIFLSSTPLDKDDLTKGVTFTVMDITKRKLAEGALQESQHLFQTLAQVSPVGIFRTDPEGNTTYVNPKWIELSGLSSEEAYGNGWLNAVHPEDREKLSEAWLINLKSRNKSSAEYRFLKPDGSILWVMGKAVPELIGNEITGYIGTIIDITQSKQAEIALRRSEEKYRRIFENVQDMYYEVLIDGTILEVSPSIGILSKGQYQMDDLIGKSMFDFYSEPEERQALLAILQEKGAVMDFEITLKNRDGSHIPCSISSKICFDAQGRPEKIIGSMRDITIRKKVEEVLKESESSLRDAQEIAKMGSWEWDIVAQKTHWSDNYFTIHGYKPDEVKPSFELFRNRIHPDDIHILDEKHAIIMKDKTPSSFELRITRPDGTVAWIQNNISPVVEDDKIVKLKGIIIDITEHKQAENALVESETKYRQLITQSPDGIFVIDLSGKFLSVNRAICESLKYTEEELFSMKMQDIVPEKYHSLHKQRLMTILNGESPNVNAEYEVRGKDGINHFVEVLSVPYYMGGKIVGFQGIARDITERKKVEDKLRSSEERLKILFDYAPDAYYLNDLRGNLIDGNIACKELMGYDKNELIGKSFLKLNLLSLKQIPRAAKLLVKNALGQPTGPDEFVLRRKDGSQVTVEIITHPVKIKDQTLVLGLARDMTARMQSEEALRASEEKYRRIFENVQDVFYELSIRGKILEASPSIELLSKGQFKRDDLIGKSMYDFYPDPTERRTLLNVLREHGFVSDFEINLKNRDGSNIPCSISAKIIFNEKGHPEKIIGSMHDITDRKNATEALKLAKEKAEASDKLKTTFLNNISHEVRTPLNGILGFAEIMSQSGLSEEEKTVSLSMLFESSDRLLNTITNYMDISLITSGNMVVNRKNFVPEQIMKELLEKYKTICSARKLELLLKIPEHSDKLSVNSDPEILSKIISHLLSNAIKFTEIGSIQYGYTVRKNEVEFFVKDTGIGIGKESLIGVFEHFVKEDRGPLKITEGSGLGLSISKGLVELLGGKIRVETESGKGSAFFFTIPAGKEFEDHIIIPPVSKQKKSKIAKYILVAEDDEVNFFYLKSMLKQNTSAEIIHASNGKEAVEKFQQNPDIGLILMDIKMPVMDGLVATRQIKAINRNIPVIAITAYAMAGDEARILDAGCDFYLTKPVDKKLFLAKMAEYIEL